MPFKHNACRRHCICKMKFKVTNWAEYEAGLRQRGSLTLWMTPEARSSWQPPKRTTRGGQPRYSDLAVETALTLGLVFGLRLRQTEGFITSVLKLIGLDLPVPDHTTLSRRASKPRMPKKRHDDRMPQKGPVHILIDSTGLQVYGAGQWLEEKHGAKSRRGWRKLHLALDADSGDIIAQVMTDQDAGDASQVEPTYDAVINHSPDAAVVIPPRANAVDRQDADLSSQRDRHIATINADGRMQWQAATGYGKRSLVETAIGRYKSIIGRRLRARSFSAQQTEVALGCAVLNRMLDCARPKSARCNKATV
ncbi:IS5 family transposase [Rhizobium sp. FKY42]|uniref:IS5 family transposase n=1 Tax=Rhizobium sp. FKY42 TaxID=2562310 RepID=UPI0010C148AA|nr:IS5 family transposase [Rhizobium sp. FKY42]